MAGQLKKNGEEKQLNDNESQRSQEPILGNYEDDPHGLLAVLAIDVISSIARIGESDTMTHRRELVRSVAAALEGLHWNLRESVAANSFFLLRLTSIERAALEGETYQIGTKGDIRPQPAFIPLTTSTRMLFRIVKQMDEGFEMDLGGKGWAALKKTIEVRNRLVHPKGAGGVKVSDQEMNEAIEAFVWFSAKVIATVKRLKDLRLAGTPNPPAS